MPARAGEDVGNVMAFSCPEKARWITGQVMYAAGGASLMHAEVALETQIG
jgi:enoyl-[acyl-carrier-protein] reductase (NADH)